MNAIVVVDQNWAIGRDNDLLFSLPTDMKRFRSLTLGGTVILGRRTLDSFPAAAPAQAAEHRHHPLPGLFPGGGGDRLQSGGHAGGHSRYPAGPAVGHRRRQHLRRSALPMRTGLRDPGGRPPAEGADSFFPNLDKLPGWTVRAVSEPVTENGLTYRFYDYVNTKLCD